MIVRSLLAFLLVLGVLVTGPASAQQTEIRVDRGVTAPLPIAVTNFTGAGPRGAEIAEIIRSNLGRSGSFAPIDPSRFVGRVTDGGALPVFSDWKLINAPYLVTGVVASDPDGRLRVQFHLWDVNGERQVAGVQFIAAAESWRRIGHKISDAVLTPLTGIGPYFDTQVVFVSESGPKTGRRRVLTLMDQDGAGAQYLTGGPEQIFTPRFSANGQEVTYMALTDAGAQVYVMNLENRRRESLGRFTGTVFAPRFSPDGSKIAFSVDRGGNSDIYVMDLRSRAARRITTDPGIDTSPSFSPDGSQIVFNSDRAGSPQLYVMSAEGGGQRRLSTGGGRYSTPVWSPTGDYIAFTKQTGPQFHIGIMRVDGSNERLLTTSYLDEGPTWAPNGRFLMFFRETPAGGPRLWTVDLNGRVQAAPFSGPGDDPSWSPLRSD